MGQKVSFLAILGLFGAILTPFDPLRTKPEFCPEKFFYSAQLDMKIHSVAKFQKKVMEGYPAIARTHARTDGRNHATENNGPSPINRGTNKRKKHNINKNKKSMLI